MKAELKCTRLVQRLLAPRVEDGQLDELARAFCFGGGGGRLTNIAWKILSPVFHFDYMGAAEFEFGAVPEALRAMSAMELSATIITVGATPVYVLCEKAHKDEIINRIRTIGKGEEHKGNEIRLHEVSYFHGALNPVKKWERECRGWLELDNGFFWSIDQEMWRKFAATFGMEVGIFGVPSKQ